VVKAKVSCISTSIESRQKQGRRMLAIVLVAQLLFVKIVGGCSQ